VRRLKARTTAARELCCMGKFPASLLIIVCQLCLISSIRADEQVRQLQEALRKRNLFSGNPNGEFSPALSTAVSHYQSRKGFPVTGRLDPETCSSLGILPLTPHVAPTPFVVEKTGDVRGSNGELLPGSTPLLARVPDASGPSSSLASDINGVLSVPAEEPPANVQKVSKVGNRRASSPGRPPAARRETNPFVLAYQTVDHALKGMFRDSHSKKKRDVRKRG
jgi:peptidoglycan hydrolase-like protein with peptidoglycan-binding domain